MHGFIEFRAHSSEDTSVYVDVSKIRMVVQRKPAGKDREVTIEFDNRTSHKLRGSAADDFLNKFRNYLIEKKARRP